MKMQMKRIWLGLAGACMGAAGLALWWQHLDAAFVIATIGVLAWFFSYRTHLQELIVERDVPVSEESTNNQPHEN